MLSELGGYWYRGKVRDEQGGRMVRGRPVDGGRCMEDESHVDVLN